MEEYLDVLDEKTLKVCTSKPRSEVHKKGLLHQTSHVWIVREKNNKFEVLLQKRSPNKDSFPDLWDTSSAGHVPAGEDPKASAIRELEEELGIKLAEDKLFHIMDWRHMYDKIFHNKEFHDNELIHLFVCNGQDIDEKTIQFQKEEISDVKWFDLDAVLEEVESGKDDFFCLNPKSARALKKYLLKNVDWRKK